MDQAEPSAEVKEAVRHAARIRGEIITSFAQIEFVLADIVVKCASRAEYKNVVARFPYKVESRISAVTALVNAPGPLQKYKDEIVRVIDHLLSYSELRDFMAHGLVMLTPTVDKDPRLEYRMYRPQSNKMLALAPLKPT